DEELVNGSFIREAVKDDHANALAVSVTNLGPKGEVQSRFNSIRLWRNGLGFSYRDIVHNQLQFHGPTQMTTITILHYGYVTGTKKSEEKYSRTISLLERQLREGTSNRAFTILNMIKIFVAFQKYDQALSAGEELLAGTVGSGALDKNLRVEFLLAMALAYYKIKSYARAAELYQQILSTTPYCVDALLGLGLMAMDTDDLENAEKWFRQYLETWGEAVQELGRSLNVHHNSFPDQIYYNLGLVFMKRKDMKQAVSFFEQALQFNPRYAVAHVQLSENYLALGDVARAEHHAGQALKLNLREAGLNLLGAVNLEKGRLSEAESCFRKCLIEFPESSYAKHNLGALLWKEGRRLDARRYFEEAAGRDPQNAVFQSSLDKALKNIKEIPTISLCMMIKNEAKFLARCLKSVETVVDEIIVVDTGSTDESVEIAKSFGVRLYEHPWFDDFSGMRNITISYATGDWIFILDGDEEFEAADKPLLRRIARSALEQSAQGVAVIVHNYYGKGKGDTKGASIRLFRNDGKIHYEGIVHNDLIIPGTVLPSPIR
ncbi:MAG: tetratricopeptide repeat protein, partial [Nitrospirota bacterium]